MEMEMRSKEDIEIAKDITPTLTPLSFALHNSHLHSHCSSCFSLIPNPIPIPIPNPTPHSSNYCSPHCSATHSSTSLSSAELHLPPSTSSSLLRTALRLLLHTHHHMLTCQNDDVGRIANLLSNNHLPTSRNDDVSENETTSLLPNRIANLLCNRHLLTCQNDDVFETIKLGARAITAAISKQRNGCSESFNDAVLEIATDSICAVLTNAVEVHDKEGCAIGIAVFEHAFSWINHSCSPNACYRFVFSSSSGSQESELRIAPFTRQSQQLQIDSGFCDSSSEFAQVEGEVGYGPRLIVRSIKRIKKGEEVTVAYTDLLQPKAERQSELWSKYRFNCSCKRCSSLPLTYVDHALQEISIFCRDPSVLRSNYKFLRDMADTRLTEFIDDVILKYLSIGNSESCCETLEKILIQGSEGSEETLHYKFMMHPLHHLSLNAYTALASAYKVRVDDLLSVDSEIDLNQLKAFSMSRISAAYSLLLTGAAHHLFNSESSLIASVANFWTSAGESLLSLTRNPEWSKFVKSDFNVSNLASVAKLKCSKCSLMDIFRARLSNDKIKGTDFENVSNEFLHCVSDTTTKVWGFLVQGCQFLKLCKDPISFSWLMSSGNHDNKSGMSSTIESDNSICIYEQQAYTGETLEHISQLSRHCLAYGGLLAYICYGPHSHLVCHVQNILDPEDAR